MITIGPEMKMIIAHHNNKAFDISNIKRITLQLYLISFLKT